ncbi:MAG: type II toxin-antitoxin system Phd/YefM family antitoxin [Steroidobacteraceae bacterium]|nr:type II toxin-antitoxin system Phd/YefM family antitoxin [Steroidobacteraceae bacterium]
MPPTPLAELPSQSATEVKNQWGQIVRQVLKTGSLAITQRSNVELVMLSAERYQALVDTIARLEARERSELEELTAQFTSRLDKLQAPEAAARVAEVLDARGRAITPPVAGASY